MTSDRRPGLRSTPREFKMAAKHAPATLVHEILYLLIVTCSMTSSALPFFDVSLVNVTVVEGQHAVLQCSIDRLGDNMVAWLSPNSMALTLGEERVIDDTRFSLVRSGSRHQTEEWNLHINEVRLSDAGQYRCSINTDPVKFKVVALHVKVPPRVTTVEDKDVIVMEMDTLAIPCNGTGIPSPDVTWTKVDDVGSEFPPQMKQGANQMLYLASIRREETGVYKCVADNGVPPVASSYVRVKVQFAPKIILPLKRLGQSLGREVLIDCIVRAFPIGEAYWMDQSDRRVVSSPEYFDESEGEVTVRLSIARVKSEDFGVYSCCAKNRVGYDCQQVELYEYKGEMRMLTPPPPPPHPPPPPPLPLPSSSPAPLHSRADIEDINNANDDYDEMPDRFRRPQLRPLLLAKTFWRANRDGGGDSNSLSSTNASEAQSSVFLLLMLLSISRTLLML